MTVITNHLLLRSLAICAFALVLCSPARALDRDRTILQLAHRTWTAKEGAPTQITSLAQTTDGYLWIGTGHGLFMFDGMRFERYEPQTGEPMQSSDVYCLFAAPDGGLWVGFRFGGVSFLKDGRAVNYAERDGLPPSRVIRIARDGDGVVWAATNTGLARLEGDRWESVRESWGFNANSAFAVFVDAQGTLWAPGGGTVYYLPAGTRKFVATSEQVGQVPQIIQGPGNTVWMSSLNPGPLSVRQIRVPGDARAPMGPDILDGSLGILFDRQASLWVTTGEGILRLRYPEKLAGQKIGRLNEGVEIFRATEGLSADFCWPILEDREGNIWVGTGAGLDQFRDIPLLPIPFTVREQQFGMVPADGGDIWTGNAGRKTTRIHSSSWEIETLSTMTAGPGIREPSGTVWLQERTAILRLRNGEQERIPWPKEVSLPQKYSAPLTVDRSGALWTCVDLAGIFRWDGVNWTRFPIPPNFEKLVPLSAFTDAQGRVWFGYGGGTIALIEDGRMQTFNRESGVTVGSVKAITGDAREVWIGGDLGLAAFDGAGFHAVRSKRDDAFGGVSGIVETEDGALWLGAARGVIHISAGEIQRVLRDPAYAVDYEVFDDRDGLPGILQQGRPFPTAIQGTDGRLWFATTGGVATLDPNRFFQSAVPPPVLIRSILADGKTYASYGRIDLPAGTTNLQIDYTALSLAVPERVRFRYKLDGVDEDWQDPGTRRAAIYTNLGPGQHHFRVIASNNDGVWNETGVTLEFNIEHAWYQTISFRVLCVVLALFVLFTLYRLRVRHVARAISVRFDERLAERTRIARELHDTLLQTVQGSKLVADDALEKSNDVVNMRHAMERLSGWLGQATQEGRAALNSLRTSTIETNDLAAALRRATEECSIDRSMVVKFSVEGGPRDMHPIARDEIYRIGYEGIRNACEHSSATELKVDLSYTHDLTLRVNDNGIGIEPAVVSEGKAAHFGLQGMRERADRIGSKLTIISSPSSGTEMTLVVPGLVIFRRPTATRWQRTKTLFGLTNRRSDSD